MVEIGHFLYGSQNYGLDTPESDKDYKVIMCPEFEDVFNYRKIEANDIPEEYDKEHYSVMAFTRVHELIKKGNPNCIEMLFSVEKHFKTLDFLSYIDTATKLYELGYLAFVWDYFYSAAKGIALNTIKRSGINSKSISRAYYWRGLAIYTLANNYVIDGFTFNSDEHIAFQEMAKNIRNSNLSNESLTTLANDISMLFNDGEEYLFNEAEFSISSMDKIVIEEIYETINQLDNIAKMIFARCIGGGIKTWV